MTFRKMKDVISKFGSSWSSDIRIVSGPFIVFVSCFIHAQWQISGGF